MRTLSIVPVLVALAFGCGKQSEPSASKSKLSSVAKAAALKLKDGNARFAATSFTCRR